MFSLVKNFTDSCSQAYGNALDTAYALYYSPEQRLLFAAEKGNLKLVQEFLNTGVDPNATSGDDNCCNTPLQIAAKYGYIEIVKALKEKGGDVKHSNCYSLTPLTYATKNGHNDVVKFLLVEGCTPRENSKIIYSAAEKGHSEVVRTLLEWEERQENPVFETVGNFFTLAKLHYDNDVDTALTVTSLLKAGVNVNSFPFYRFVVSNYPKTVKILLDNGADPNRDTSNKTPCFYASIERGSAEVVDLLLSNGIEVDASLPSHQNAIKEAVHNEHLGVLEVLHKHNLFDPNTNITFWRASGAISSTPLIYALMENLPKKTVSFLLEKGANIESENVDGYTPLHLAVLYGKTPLAKFLLDKGADLETRNKKGETLLYSAFHRGKEETVDLLLRKGASIEAKNNDGEPLLHQATKEADPHTARLLLKKGAIPNSVDQNGCTALHKALKIAHIELLLAAGVDSNIQNQEGNTSLHCTLKERFHRNKRVQLLLEAGAKRYIKNKEGKTPLDVAQEMDLRYTKTDEELIALLSPQNEKSVLHRAIDAGSIEVAKGMLESCADPNVKDPTNGKSPLYKAVERGAAPLVNSLLLAKADPNMGDDGTGVTPFHKALESESSSLVKSLLRANANLNEKESSRALNMALEDDDLALVRLLQINPNMKV